jgi:hypothetical protein
MRFSVNPTAFVAALFLAPLVVTLLSFWTIIGMFALPLGIIPYLVIGTPILLWAVGRLRPGFMRYAALGLLGDGILYVSAAALVLLRGPNSTEVEVLKMLALFGLIFAPLYAGTFGTLYAKFHPNIRLLQT